MADNKKYGFRTTMSHIARRPKTEHGFVNPPLLRGSTVLVPTVKERQAMQARRGERVLTYGLGGSETHWALEDAIAAANLLPKTRLPKKSQRPKVIRRNIGIQPI